MTNHDNVLGPSDAATDKLVIARSGSNGRYVLATHFLAFLIASAGAFLPRNDMLLPGIDGEFTRITAMQLFRFGDPLGLSMAPFEGMGTLFLNNPLLSPSLLPIALFGEDVGIWLGFMICAGLIFFSTYVLGRSLGMGRGISLLAAWALPPLCLPYQSWLNLYLTYGLNPLAGDTISFAVLGLALLARGYTTSRLPWTALGLMIVVLWLFLANPLWIMLLLPTAIPVSIGIVLIHAHRPDFLRRSAALLLPAAVFVAVGGGVYLWGLFSDTAVAFFPQEVKSSVGHSWRLFTVATPWHETIDPIGGSWVALAFFGLTLAIWRGRKTLRAAAFSVLGAIALFASYGTAYMITSSWALPLPIYFEFLLWPFYALFAAYAIGALARYLADTVREHAPRLAVRFTLARVAPWQYLGLWALTGAVLGILLANYPFTLASPSHRPTDTAITKALRLASIAPNAPFGGYVATLAGFDGPSGASTDWFDLMKESNRALDNFGNIHRIVDLWRFGVPSFEPYSQILEPALYGVTTRLLDRPGDRQIRNILIVTQTNIPLMESLGIRFLVTDYPLPEPARLAAELVSPAVSHFVFELPDPNYGGFSPTDVVIARDATDVLERIADPNFNFRKTVVLNEPLDMVLQSAQSSQANLVRGGWRIRAQSAGVSLILLPLQPSNCFTVSEHQGSTGRVLAVRRANLVNTAVVFEGTIDVALTLHVSPFWNPDCRVRDAREMKEFGLANIPSQDLSRNDQGEPLSS